MEAVVAAVETTEQVKLEVELAAEVECTGKLIQSYQAPTSNQIFGS